MSKETIIVLLCVVLSALPQQAPEKDQSLPFKALDFLIGDWEAISKPGEGAGSFSFTREAQGRVLVRRNHAEYPAADGRPAGAHDDLMVIYQDGGSLRADYFDNEGHVIHYVAQGGAEGEVTFVSEAGADGPRYRLSYARNPNGNVRGKFEIAPPGNPNGFTQYLAWEAKRQVAKPDGRGRH
jgi:hypothetical protein